MTIKTLAPTGRRRALTLCALATLVLLLPFDKAPAQTSCENLKNLVLPNTTITLAQSLPAGPNPAPVGNLPTAICRVVGHMRPSSDSDIEIEAWLPATNWNGKFQGVGNGTFTGEIMYDALMSGIRGGYATISSDTGHKSDGDDASWALGHPEKLIDYAYRSAHEMTLKGKAIVQAFYGANPRFSYWSGCSSGGRQGLKEAQMYPEDYDGIAIGAPVNFHSHLMAAHIYNAQAAFSNGQASPDYIPPNKWQVIANAALGLCDARDGIEDGIITDPSSCNFDPATLRCPGGNAPTCLTAAQVQTAKKIYAGPRFSNGQPFFPGVPPSSEIGWGATAGGPEPFSVPYTHFKYLVFGNPNWDWRTFNVDTDVPFADTLPAAAIDSTNPNLAAFKARGGKLVVWHGWIDAISFAKNSINYLQSVQDALGGVAKTDDFFRLFMAPGVQHCGGGPGPNVIDDLGALERWVEQGIAPSQVVAAHFTNGAVDRRRPLCPYPQVAAYRGSGNINAPENFRCESPDARFAFADRGGASLSSLGSAGSVSVGYASLQPDAGNTMPSGLAIFSLRQNNVLVSEASVPASPLIKNGRIYAEINAPVNTGLAIANPNAQIATVSFYFTDRNGNFGDGKVEIPANGQIARFLDQAPFAGRTLLNGSFSFTASIPVSVVALRGFTNDRGEFLITTLPVTDLDAAPPTGGLVLPHLVDGGGWTTQVLMVNPTDSVMSGTVQFRGPAGQFGDSFPYTISARNSGKVQTMDPGRPAIGGSVLIIPSSNIAPSAVAVFSFRNGNGTTVTEAGVPAVAAATAFRLYGETSADISANAVGSIQTGLAITNTTGSMAVVMIEANRLDGSPTGLVGTLNIPANGHTALYLNQIPGLASLSTPFQGVIRVSSAAAISVVGLRGRYNERSDFLITATLPVSEVAAVSNSPLYFPHIADSGGYTTQFILFSGRTGQASSGALTFFTQAGGRWNLSVR